MLRQLLQLIYCVITAKMHFIILSVSYMCMSHSECFIIDKTVNNELLLLFYFIIMILF